MFHFLQGTINVLQGGGGGGQQSMVKDHIFTFLFFLPFPNTLSKIGDQIKKYVVKDHCFPFLKWCDTIGSVVWVLELCELPGELTVDRGVGVVGVGGVVVGVGIFVIVQINLCNSKTVCTATAAAPPESLLNLPIPTTLFLCLGAVQIYQSSPLHQSHKNILFI